MAKHNYQGSQTVITFAYLMQSAKIQLKNAEDEIEGNAHASMASLILSAFSMEAALNHIGAEIFNFWEDVEKNLSPKSKLAFICNELEKTPDFSREPYQSFSKVFKFRNDLAHGKTETINGTWSAKCDEKPLSPLKAQWEKLCNPRDARKVQENIEQIVIELYKKAELGANPFAILGHGFSIGD